MVSLVGNGDRLAVVTHASSPLPSRDQMLEFMLLNVRTQKRLLTGRLPLSPGSTLTWIGFSEAGSLSSYDSQVCVLRLPDRHIIEIVGLVPELCQLPSITHACSAVRC